LYDLYKREVEDRAEKKTTEEILRLFGEWDKLSLEEKSKHAFENFVRRKLAQPGKKR
jgi:hypothetical protein